MKNGVALHMHCILSLFCTGRPYDEATVKILSSNCLVCPVWSVLSGQATVNHGYTKGAVCCSRCDVAIKVHASMNTCHTATHHKYHPRITGFSPNQPTGYAAILLIGCVACHARAWAASAALHESNCQNTHASQQVSTRRSLTTGSARTAALDKGHG